MNDTSAGAVNGEDRPRRASGLSAWRVLDGVGEAIIGVALLGEVTVVLANVAARTLFNAPMLWTEEIAQLSLSILAFVGGALAYRHEHHAAVAILLNRLSPRARLVCLAIADFLVLGLSLILLYFSLRLVVSEWSRETPVLQMSSSVFMLPLSQRSPLDQRFDQLHGQLIYLAILPI